MNQELRGHSTTTWTKFCHFFTLPTLCGQFIYPEHGQKHTFFDPLPPHHVVASYSMLLKWLWMDTYLCINIFYWIFCCEFSKNVLREKRITRHVTWLNSQHKKIENQYALMKRRCQSQITCMTSEHSTYVFLGWALVTSINQISACESLSFVY